MAVLNELDRWQQGIDGPLFLGIDTHALSEPAFTSALCRVITIARLFTT